MRARLPYTICPPPTRPSNRQNLGVRQYYHRFCFRLRLSAAHNANKCVGRQWCRLRVLGPVYSLVRLLPVVWPPARVGRDTGEEVHDRRSFRPRFRRMLYVGFPLASEIMQLNRNFVRVE